MEEPSSEADTSNSTKDISALRLEDRMLRLLNDSTYYDVTFIVGPTQESIGAHKLILISASHVFEAMFSGQLAEKFFSHTTIQVPDLHPIGFKNLITFIYSNQFDFVYERDVALIIYCLSAAKKYLVKPLIQHARNSLGEILNLNNVLEVMEELDSTDEEDLIDQCLKIIDYHFDELINTPEFLELSENQLISIIQRDSLLSPEKTILDAIYIWTQNKLNRTTNDKNNHEVEQNNVSSLQTIAKPILIYLRKNLLNQSDLCVYCDCDIQYKLALFSSSDYVEWLSNTSSSASTNNPRQQSLSSMPNSLLNLGTILDMSMMKSTFTGITNTRSIPPHFVDHDYFGAIELCFSHKIILSGLRLLSSKQFPSSTACVVGAGGTFLHLPKATVHIYSKHQCKMIKDKCFYHNDNLVDTFTVSLESPQGLVPVSRLTFPRPIPFYPGQWYCISVRLIDFKADYFSSKPLVQFVDGPIVVKFSEPENATPYLKFFYALEYYNASYRKYWPFEASQLNSA